MIISIDGILLPEEDAKISVLDHGVLLGDGLFETMRTYDGKLFRYLQHFKRLEEGAKEIFLNLPCTSEQLHEKIGEVILANKLCEARVRVTVTRGRGPSGLSIDCEWLVHCR